jgi:hypothetical protein
MIHCQKRRPGLSLTQDTRQTGTTSGVSAPKCERLAGSAPNRAMLPTALDAVPGGRMGSLDILGESRFDGKLELMYSAETRRLGFECPSCMIGSTTRPVEK